MFKSLNEVKKIESEEEFNQVLKLFQEKFYLCTNNKEAAVMTVLDSGEIKEYSIRGFKDFYQKYKYTTPIINTTRVLTKYVTKEFLESYNTIALDGIFFNPQYNPGYVESLKKYNIWKGFKYKPVKGNVHSFLTLIDANCGGDIDAFDYLLKYLALAIQKPWENPRTAICIIGEQGTGKGTLVNDTILKLTENSAHLNSLAQITGQFNSKLKDAVFVCLDECSFGGDIKEANLLKTFVSESQIMINEKYEKEKIIDSFKKIFILSNNDYVVNVEQSDRRYAVFRASTKLKEDKKWFKRYQKWLENGGYEAVMHYLMYEVDISDFNPLDIPKTKEKVDLQLRSADLTVKFIFDLLDGNINYNANMIRNNKIYKEELKQEFIDYCKTYYPKSFMPSIHDLNKTMGKAFGYDREKPNWRKAWRDKGGYYYIIKSFEDYQEKFAKNMFNLDYKDLFNNQKIIQDPVEILDNIFDKA